MLIFWPTIQILINGGLQWNHIEVNQLKLEYVSKKIILDSSNNTNIPILYSYFKDTEAVLSALKHAQTQFRDGGLHGFTLEGLNTV